MVDKNEQGGPTQESVESGTSVFDLFEPPPERDPNSFGKIPVIKDGEIDLTDSSAEAKAAADAEAAGLQHWTAPATGQVPAILSGEGDETGMWGDVKGPSWHGEDTSWTGPDLADVFADTESVSSDNTLVDLDDDDDEGEYRDEFDQPAVPRPVRVVSSIRPEPDQDQTMPPANANVGANLPAETEHGLRPQLPPRPTPAPVQPRTGPATGSAQPSATERTVLGQQAPPTPSTPSIDVPPPDVLPTGAPATDMPPPVRRSAPVAAATGRPEATRPTGGAAVPPDRSGEPNIDDIRFADTDPSDLGISPRRHQVDLRQQHEAEYEEEYDDLYDDDDYADGSGLGPVGGRNLPQAIGVGLGLVAVLLTAMFFGPYPTLLLVVVLALLAVLELYNAMRVAGLRPATLLGIVGTVAAPAAAYVRGDAAFPLIVAFAVVFGILWYLVGADTERPVLNLSLTMMGIFWIGGLAAFAALMVREDLGIQLLLATIIITVASDTLAYIGGRAYGSRPFHHASPNKTWEGTITGFVGAVFAGFAIGVTEMGTLWDGRLVAAMVLGAVVGCLAPMGDLAESVVKRDLGVKDMGTLLPGHGGVLDRIDALLFALPGAYYVALVYGLF